MDERLKFVARLLDGEKMAVLCREFEISRMSFFAVKEPGMFGVMAPLSAGIPVVQA